MNQSTKFILQENDFENVIHKIATVLFMSKCADIIKNKRKRNCDHILEYPSPIGIWTGKNTEVITYLGVDHPS